MGVVDVAYGVWSWTKRVLKATTAAAAVGYAYAIGTGGAMVVDSYRYISEGIFHIDMATFPQYFMDNAATVLRHSNEVGGALASIAGFGAALSLYKIRRR